MRFHLNVSDYRNKFWMYVDLDQMEARWMPRANKAKFRRRLRWLARERRYQLFLERLPIEFGKIFTKHLTPKTAKSLYMRPFATLINSLKKPHRSRDILRIAASGVVLSESED